MIYYLALGAVALVSFYVHRVTRPLSVKRSTLAFYQRQAWTHGHDGVSWRWPIGKGKP